MSVRIKVAFAKAVKGDEMPQITLLIFHERNSNGPVWWSESPEIPGFHAVDDSLDGLIERSRNAVSEILAESEPSVGEIEFNYELQGSIPATEGDDMISWRDAGNQTFEWLMHDPNTTGDDAILA